MNAKQGKIRVSYIFQHQVPRFFCRINLNCQLSTEKMFETSTLLVPHAQTSIMSSLGTKKQERIPPTQRKNTVKTPWTTMKLQIECEGTGKFWYSL